MAKIVVDISELRKENADKVEYLAKLLRENLSEKVDIAAEEITIIYEKTEMALPKAHLRVLLKKFLHRAGLREDFRVISGKEKKYVIKRLPKFEEED